MSTEERTATIPVSDTGASAPSPVPGTPAPKKRKRRHKALRRIITTLVILAILAGIAFAVWYFVFRKTEVTGDIVTATASISTIQSSVEGSGNARAGGSAAITVTSDGVVQDVMVAEGDQVYEGQQLYNMNSPAAEQKVADAEKAITDQEKNIQSLIRAVSTAEKAVTAREKDVEAREKDLEALYAAIDDRRADVETAKEAVEDRRADVEDAKQAVEDRKADVETAKEAVLEAQQAVEDAKKAVEDRKADLEKLQGELTELRARVSELTVTAPFSGKLTEVADLVSGQNLTAGEEIATLVDDSRFRLSLYFSYAYKDAITVGQTATVSLPSAMGTVTGRVDEVNMINFISGEGASFFEVVVSFENPGSLTAGMKASATLTGPDGASIFPYDSGELAYYDSVAVKTTLAGPLKQISTLRRYADVKAGQTLIIQGSDELDKAVSAKEEEITAAEEAVTAAEKAVPVAENGVTAAQRGVANAEKAVTAAEKAVTAAEKAVTDAEKAVTAAEDAVTTASTEDIEAGEQAIEDAKQDIVYAQEDVVAANDAVTAGYERLEELKEALAKAESELLDFNAVAPISGTITSCTIAKGQEVAAGTTVITISDTTNMVVEITVDDRNIPFVKPGMSVDLSDWNDMTYVGTVTKIDMENSESGYSGMTSYPVTLSVENSSGSLLQGMWLDYSFITSESADCVTVPIQCVKSIVDTDGNPQDVVFIQADSEPENAVSFEPPEADPYAYNPVKYPTPEEGYWPVPVVTGLSDRYNVEIVSGLSDGDTVFSAYMMTGAWS